MHSLIARQGDVSVNQIHGDLPMAFIGAIDKQVDESVIKVLVCFSGVNSVLNAYAAS